MNKFWKKIAWPEYIFGFILFFVLLSYLAFYLIDLRNIFGFRDALFNLDSRYFFFDYTPFFFQHWGRNSGLAEIIQWLCLSFSAIIAAFAAGFVYQKNKKLFGFWIIMSVAFILMLLEDAGNIRHFFMSYIQAGAGEIDQGIVGTLAELLYFAVLAFIPLFALVYYWKSVKTIVKTKIYLLLGFVFYAVAESLSFAGSAFEGLLNKNFYTLAGEKFYQLCLALGDRGLAEAWGSWSGDFSIYFILMDSLLEESLELIGAGAFLAAAVSFLIYLKNSHGLFAKSDQENKG